MPDWRRKGGCGLPGTQPRASGGLPCGGSVAVYKRQAAVFWWILMAMRAVIPLYVCYAIYLYWTLPLAVRYSGGGY